MRCTDNFSDATPNDSYNINISSNQDYISSLAANKDGVFVAVRTITASPAEEDKKYKIEVHKYSHNNAASPEKTIQLVSEEPLYQAIQGTDTPSSRKKRVDETVHSLQIKNGVLYGLTTEISAGVSAKKLYGYDIENITSETSGDFAPTRFIAIKPKKLVIASTGYKCLQHAGNPEYKPKICEFDLETAAMEVVYKGSGILYKDFDASAYCWK